MRKLIISLLLASVAATPAMAFDRSDREAAREEREARAKEEREERQKAREERQQAREAEQPAQIERAPRVERVRERSNEAPAVNMEAPADRRERSERRRQGTQQAIESQQIDARERFERRRQGSQQSQQLERRADQQPGTAIARDARQRADARRQQWDQNRAERIARQQAIRNSRPPVVSTTPRPGTQPPPPPPSARPSHAPTINWSSSHWRNDRRYDWYKHRNKYWWLFQLGWYSDPFGWGYQPYGIGWRMWPSYYSSHYWLNDPWQYRLPYAPAGTRWIRYWDDAILVDLWSGQVVDVIYNFFW